MVILERIEYTMKCSNCGNELTSDMYSSGMCFSCGQSISDSEKAIMEEMDKQKSEQQEKINQQKIELQNQYDEKLKNHMLTTGYAFDGYVISKYHGLVSGEYVIGSGLASYLEACITTPLGMDTYGYSEKIKAVKQLALEDMVKQSISAGGNAIVGISFSFLNLLHNMIGISVDGTSVTTEKKATGQEE